jgi:hypothetical protein
MKEITTNLKCFIKQYQKKIEALEENFDIEDLEPNLDSLFKAYQNKSKQPKEYQEELLTAKKTIRFYTEPIISATLTCISSKLQPEAYEKIYDIILKEWLLKQEGKIVLYSSRNFKLDFTAAFLQSLNKWLKSKGFDDEEVLERMDSFLIESNCKRKSGRDIPAKEFILNHYLRDNTWLKDLGWKTDVEEGEKDGWVYRENSDANSFNERLRYHGDIRKWELERRVETKSAPKSKLERVMYDRIPNSYQRPYSLQDSEVYSTIFDRDNAQKDRLRSTNFSLFGNIGFWEECTLAYFIKSLSVTDYDEVLDRLIEDNYATFLNEKKNKKIKKEYLEIRKKNSELFKSLKKSLGTLMLFEIPCGKVDQYVYTSYPVGIPFKVSKTPGSKPELVDFEFTYDLATRKSLNWEKNEKVFNIVNFGQARILDLCWSEFGKKDGIDISFNTFYPQKGKGSLEEYKEAIEEIFKDED